MQEQIVQRRSLAAGTVLGHLAKALELGYFVDYRKGHLHTKHSYILYLTCVFSAAGLTEEMEEMITSTIRKEPIYSSKLFNSYTMSVVCREGLNTMDETCLIHSLYRYIFSKTHQRSVQGTGGLWLHHLDHCHSEDQDGLCDNMLYISSSPTTPTLQYSHHILHTTSGEV